MSINILVFTMSILSFLLCLSLKESREEDDAINVILDNVAIVGENTLGLNKNPTINSSNVEKVLNQ